MGARRRGGFMRTVPCQHPDRPAARRVSGGSVDPAVTHHEGTRRIKVPLAACLLDEARARFAAAARHAIAGDWRLRMMRAVVVRVRRGARRRQMPIEQRVDLVEERLVDDATADRGLVRDDDQLEPGTAQEAQRVGGPRKDREQIESIDVAAIFGERAVAIEKHGRPWRGRQAQTSCTALNTSSGVSRVMHR
jgi:hypothetical protein